MTYYGNLCTQMYVLDKPNAPEEEFDFYIKYATSKEMKILEPMCGTGRFLIPFAEKGYNIDGFDISKDMLDVCQRKSDKKGLSLNLINTSIEDFSTNKKYDLIMMPGQSFSLIVEDEAVFSNLRKLRDLLTDNGTLLIEILTTVCKCGKSDEWILSNKKVRSDGKTIVESSKSDYDETKKLITFPLKYELLDNDQLVESETMDLRIRLYEIKDMKQILKEVGFSKTRVIKAYNHEEVPNSSDDTVIFECKL